jgi:hypothetical protein
MSNTPQPLLGTIGGVVAGKLVKKAVGAAVDRLAASPNTQVHPADRDAVTAVVAAEVSKELDSRLKHTANQEPFYKSRVTIGALGSIFSGIAILLTSIGSGSFDPTQLGLAVTSILGGVFAIYGRWVAVKPLGE